MKKIVQYTLYINTTNLAQVDSDGIPSVSMILGHVAADTLTRACGSVQFLGHFTQEVEVNVPAVHAAVEGQLDVAIDKAEALVKQLSNLRKSYALNRCLAYQEVDLVQGALTLSSRVDDIPF